MKEGDFSKPFSDLIAQISQFSTATVYEAMGQTGAIHSSIKPLNKKMKLCGPAITVEGKPGDNLALHKVIYLAQPGDIMVVSVGGYDEAGYWGEIMTAAAKARKLGGLVLDGGIRDSEILEDLQFPIFCKNVCIKGTAKLYPGKFGEPLNFMGTIIHPGDIVLGDGDGLVVIRRNMLEEVIKLSLERTQKESNILRMLESKSTLEIYNLGE